MLHVMFSSILSILTSSSSSSLESSHILIECCTLCITVFQSNLMDSRIVYYNYLMIPTEQSGLCDEPLTTDGA
jgi:hypothetical protein